MTVWKGSGVCQEHRSAPPMHLLDRTERGLKVHALASAVFQLHEQPGHVYITDTLNYETWQ